MFLSDKNVQDCLAYKHGLITAEELADRNNFSDVEYVRQWADKATFSVRQYEAFAANQKAERKVKTVSSEMWGVSDTQNYDARSARMTPEGHRKLYASELAK